MNIRVRVLDVTHVQPDQTTNQPRDDAKIKLSPFDTFFLGLRPFQRLFFYDDGDGTSLPPFPSLVSSLRVSLGATLAVFTPLAGKLTACSDDHDIAIDCSPEAVHPGVRFVEAEYSGDAADMRRLARDVEHDTEAFLQLVPELEVGRLPAPVLAVQVTRPGNGGGAVAVGVSVHHAAADGQSLWQFLRAWSTASREGSLAGAAVAVPTFDRSGILRHPKAEAAARNLARLSAPALPKVNTLPEPDWTRQSRRTYLVTAGQIKSLKRRILQSQATAKNDDGGEQNHPPEPPTTYVAIASLLWTSIARAKCVHNAAADDEEYFLFPADCCRRMRPPLGPGFFGNCIKVRYARATTGDLVCRDDDKDGDGVSAGDPRALGGGGPAGRRRPVGGDQPRRPAGKAREAGVVPPVHGVRGGLRMGAAEPGGTCVRVHRGDDDARRGAGRRGAGVRGAWPGTHGRLRGQFPVAGLRMRHQRG